MKVTQALTENDSTQKASAWKLRSAREVSHGGFKTVSEERV